jgi:hypothetical protein
MPRSKGWLKADALRTAYIREQYATIGPDGCRHVVELYWDGQQNQYVVTQRDYSGPQEMRFKHTDVRFLESQLGEARECFTEAVAEIESA